MPERACMYDSIASSLVKIDIFACLLQICLDYSLLHIYYDSYISRVFKLFIYKKAIFIR